jgi:hypothetical protein
MSRYVVELQSLLKYYIIPLLNLSTFIPPVPPGPPLPSISSSYRIQPSPATELPIAERYLKAINSRNNLENQPLGNGTLFQMPEIQESSSSLALPTPVAQRLIPSPVANRNQPTVSKRTALSSNLSMSDLHSQSPIVSASSSSLRHPLRPVTSKVNLLLHKFSSASLKDPLALDSSPIMLPDSFRDILDVLPKMVAGHEELSKALRMKWEKEIPLVRGLEAIWCEQVESFLFYFYDYRVAIDTDSMRQ